MRERVKNTGVVRAAVIGVATMLLGGCSETGQFGNTFGSPFASSRPPVDRTPTGSLPPNEQVQNFFSEAFKPFDAQQPARQAQAAPRARQASAPSYRPPAPISAAPIAPVSAAPLAPVAVQPLSSPTIARTAANAVGGWTAEGGTSVAAGPGDTPAALAQRYGVPVDALMGVNGFASRGALPAGTRVTIPVYAAHNAGRNFAAQPGFAAPIKAAPQAIVAPVRQAAAPVVANVANERAAAHSLVAEESAAVRQAPAAVRSGAARAVETVPSRAELAPKNLGTLPEETARKALAAPEKNLRQAAALPAQAQAKLAQAKPAQAKPAQAKPVPITPDQVKPDVAAAKPSRVAAAPAMIPGAVAPTKGETPKLAKLEQKHAAPEAAAPVALAEKPAPAAAAVQAAPVEKAAPADKGATLADATAASDSANPEFRWPARGRVIQGFGNGGNDGINIAVPEGTQVKAAEGGVVAYAGSELKGYGNLVLIKHPNGYVTAYANNGSLNVKKGDAVKRGQTIALSGQSGNVSSPQLHFELRKGSKPVDPSNYLAGL